LTLLLKGMDVQEWLSKVSYICSALLPAACSSPLISLLVIGGAVLKGWTA